MKITSGIWKRACDSYGKVRHSRKYDCVYTTIKGKSGGDLLVTVASRIESPQDANVIAAVPLLLEYVKRQATSDSRAKAILDAIDDPYVAALEDAARELGYSL